MSRRVVWVAAVCAMCIAGCHHRAPRATSEVELTIHGVSSVTGTGFEQMLILQTEQSSRRLHASVSDSAALVRVAGLELSVHGVESNGALRVTSFTVVSANGSPVVDGILRVDGDRVTLTTHQGAVAIGNAPPGLRRLVGARVWVQGPLDRGPNQYGVITPAP